MVGAGPRIRTDFTTFLAQNYAPMVDALLAEVDSGAVAYRPLLARELAPVRDLVRDPEPVLRLAAQVPPAVCHNDFNPDNLLLRRTPQGQDELVAFDWQMIGVAPADGAPAVVDRYVAATAASHVPDLALRALRLAREASAAGRVMDDRPATPNGEPASTS